MKLPMIISALLLVASCGQGGGGTSDEGQATGSTDANRLEDIQVSRDFDFIGGEKLSFSVLNQSNSQARLYLNVCSDFSEKNGEYQISYDSCLLRTALDSQYTEFEIQISNTHKELIAQIWSLSEGSEPVNHRWKWVDDGYQWEINIL
ncbi:MAG: hypothetical protein AAF353_04215 [Pseudomonadota bacterium]